MSQLAPRDQPAVANVIPYARTAAAYPLTPPPQQSIGDAVRRFRRFIDIMERAADEMTEAAYEPYPCSICGVDVGRWLPWQQRRHFVSHPLAERARVLGWYRAVMG